MNIKLTIESSEGGISPIPANVSKEGRITANVATAIEKLLKYKTVKKPFMSVYINDELINQHMYSGGSLNTFKRLNFDIMKDILGSRFHAEDKVMDTLSNDKESLAIAKIFGFKGTKVSYGDAVANIEGVQKAVKLRAKYQAMEAKKIAAALAGPEIMALEEKATEERRLIAAKKKAAQITAGK